MKTKEVYHSIKVSPKITSTEAMEVLQRVLVNFISTCFPFSLSPFLSVWFLGHFFSIRVILFLLPDSVVGIWFAPSSICLIFSFSSSCATAVSLFSKRCSSIRVPMKEKRNRISTVTWTFPFTFDLFFKFITLPLTENEKNENESGDQFKKIGEILNWRFLIGKKYQSWRRRQPNQFNLWYFDIVYSQFILFIPVFCHFAHFFMALSLILHLFFLFKGRRNVLNCIAISPFVSTSLCHLTLFHSPI